ncbi:helix-turn-helix domain-containing protein [Paraflavitalea sp. CAU 1676]|uniref:helix-turn-helix domain-containing protein n=1 Tax=Paraflavitalea sp. CAU 1676 TaxID=3032598 RepID=UPI0023D9A0AC|nr:helix-turn-helix domain-containing protein [Paraflavitalea sp. CAU 1676]MDF2192266.1 helix-turn-helix domain-containing protein [Paraflavitalea sp. CAU 1676]
MTDSMFILPDFFKWLFWMAGAQGIILSIVLWRQKSNRQQNKLLSLILLTFSLGLFYFIATYTKAIYSHPLYPGTMSGWIIGTAGATLLLMYLRTCFGLPAHPRMAWLYWLPTAFFVGLAIVYYTNPKRNGEDYALLGWIGLLYFISITILCCLRFSKFSRWSTIAQQSQKTKLYLKWVLSMYASYCVLQLITFSLWYFVPFVVALYVSVSVKLITSVAIYVIAYLNVQHAHQVAPVMMALPVEQAEKYRFSSLDEDMANSIREQLMALVGAEKIYLQRDLKLKEVADRLNTSVHHLSQVLNERMGISFSDFVNKLRIEEAARLLAAGDDSKIESIALDTGFNNKVSFNKAFKKFTGTTPSQYKIQHLADAAIDAHHH